LIRRAQVASLPPNRPQALGFLLFNISASPCYRNTETPEHPLRISATPRGIPKVFGPSSLPLPEPRKRGTTSDRSNVSPLLPPSSGGGVSPKHRAAPRLPKHRPPSLSSFVPNRVNAGLRAIRPSSLRGNHPGQIPVQGKFCLDGLVLRRTPCLLRLAAPESTP
jgi:hypothetical protein